MLRTAYENRLSLVGSEMCIRDSPYVLGVSGGAAFATLLGMIYGVAIALLPKLT